MIESAGTVEARPPNRTIPLSAYAIFLAFFALLLFITHLSYLRLPYFWDEAAQFIPWALDVYHGGSLIASSIKPNIHPPAVAAYLAEVWRLIGFSPVATRSAMLLLAAFELLAAFLLAIELSKDVRGMPAFLAATLLFALPLFFAQSMLAQLDAPAMLFTTLALLWFLQDRILLSAAACVALVLTKETGVVPPLVFGLVLARERRWREASYFLAPVVILTTWVAVLYSVTGQWAGNAAFAKYNVFDALRPVHILTALLRRLYFLLVADFRWIGTMAIVIVWRNGYLRSRSWRIAFLVLAAHTALVSFVGGAILERYLLPVMPVVFAAMAAALTLFRVRQRVAASLILFAASAAGNLINPPYPFPLDNNLAFTDFLSLQSDAAEYLSHWYSQATVTTAWPLTMELRQPELGFVSRRFDVRSIGNFTPAALAAADWRHASVVVVFARSWTPPNSLLQLGPVQRVWRHLYNYVPEVGMDESRLRVPLPLEQRLERHGLWLDIYASPDAPRGLPTPVQTAKAPDAVEWRPGTNTPAAESSCARCRAREADGPGDRQPEPGESVLSTEILRFAQPTHLAKAVFAGHSRVPVPGSKPPENRR